MNFNSLINLAKSNEFMHQNRMNIPKSNEYAPKSNEFVPKSNEFVPKSNEFVTNSWSRQVAIVAPVGS
jgi:hypothetical protein